MNRDHDYGGVIANQLATLEHLGLFTKPLPTPPEKLPQLADYRRREGQTSTLRARSYLHANCAHCHTQVGRRQRRVPAAGDAAAEGHWASSTSSRARATFDLKDPRILVPGDPERSMIHHRMTHDRPGPDAAHRARTWWTSRR